MLPSKRVSSSPAQADGQGRTDSEDPRLASSPARKATAKEASKQQLSRGKRSDSARNEKAEHSYPEEDRRGAVRPGSQLPRSRAAAPPATQWDFDERLDTRATRDDESLRRNIRWQWHRTAQRLVSVAGLSFLTLAFLALVRLEGLPPRTAAPLTLACLIGGSGGYVLRGLLAAITNKRRPRDHDGDDDPSS
jgi:hypothetical protein